MTNPQLPHSNDYLPALTSLRGIAAFWVMLFHIDVLTYYRELGSLVQHDATSLISSGYLWVDFFFVLSGFIIRHSYSPLFTYGLNLVVAKTYISARFWRIYPLHIVTLISLVPLAIGLPLLVESVLSDSSWDTFFAPGAFFQSVFLLNAHNQHEYLAWNIVSWSIGAEWWTYCLALAVLPVLVKCRPLAAAVLLGIASVGLAILVYGFKGGSLDITFDYGFIRCWLGFLVGMGLHVIFQHHKDSPILCSDTLIWLVLIFVCTGLHLNWPDFLIFVLMAGLVLLAACNQGRFKRLMSRDALQYLGRISFSVYLVHGVVFMSLWFTLPIATQSLMITSFSIVQHLCLWFGFIVSTVAISHLSYTYVERRFRYGIRFTEKTRANSRSA